MSTAKRRKKPTIEEDTVTAILCHDEILRSLTAAVRKAKECGDALLRIKKQLKHGEWMTWLENNFPASYETANNYVKLAKNWRFLVTRHAEPDAVLTIDGALKVINQLKTKKPIPDPKPDAVREARRYLTRLFEEQLGYWSDAEILFLSRRSYILGQDLQQALDTLQKDVTPLAACFNEASDYVNQTSDDPDKSKEELDKAFEARKELVQWRIWEEFGKRPNLTPYQRNVIRNELQDAPFLDELPEWVRTYGSDASEPHSTAPNRRPLVRHDLSTILLDAMEYGLWDENDEGATTPKYAVREHVRQRLDRP